METLRAKTSAKCRFWNYDGYTVIEREIPAGTPVELNKIFNNNVVILSFLNSSWESEQEGQTHAEPSGCLVIRDAGQVFSTRSNTVSPSGGICREVHIAPEFLHTLVDEARNDISPFEFATPVLTSPAASQAVLGLHELVDNQSSHIEREARFYSLIDAVSKATAGQPQRPRIRRGNFRIGQAVNHLKDNFDQPIQLDELAKIVDMNPFVLLRHFKQEIGVTPGDYLLTYRINRAKQFIKEGRTLSDVANLCGFSDQSHFTHQFRRRTGITPGKFVSAI